jgi:hypothetical protein
MQTVPPFPPPETLAPNTPRVEPITNHFNDLVSVFDFPNPTAEIAFVTLHHQVSHSYQDACLSSCFLKAFNKILNSFTLAFS